MINYKFKEFVPASRLEGEGVVKDVPDKEIASDLGLITNFQETICSMSSVFCFTVFKHKVCYFAAYFVRWFSLAIVLFEVHSDYVLLVHRYLSTCDSNVIFIVI